MRLVNAETLSLEDYTLKPKPRYAILSHTWEVDEEITYQEFITRSRPQKKGWTKIRHTCELALQNDLEYVWIDTCCIDKSSSAELSEAMNSMYVWYQRSQQCFAVLSDLAADNHDAIMESRWWTRGWTLQELIAPGRLTFYDSAWGLVGDREDHCDTINRYTNIPTAVLRQECDLSSLPVAVRMSWASRRSTTREEDEAYCLLGIFDVAMPLIYGEGRKAFLRLQEEVVKRSHDLTILGSTLAGPRNGAFATSASAFQDCAFVSKLILRKHVPSEWSITNRGLLFSTKAALHIIAHTPGPEPGPDIYALPICQSFGKVQGSVYLCLRKVAPSLYQRHPHFPAAVLRDLLAPYREIVENSLTILNDEVMVFQDKKHRSRYTVRVLQSKTFKIEQVAPEELWDDERQWFKDEPGHHGPDHFPRVNMVLVSVAVRRNVKHVLVYWSPVDGEYTDRPTETVHVMPVDSVLNQVKKFLLYRRPNIILMDDFLEHFDTARSKSCTELKFGDQNVIVRAVLAKVGFHLYDLVMSIDDTLHLES